MSVSNASRVLTIRENVSLALRMVQRVGNKVTDYSHTDEAVFSSQTQAIVDQIKLNPPITNFQPWQVRDAQAKRRDIYGHDKNVDVERLDIQITLLDTTLPARIYTPRSSGAKSSKNNATLVYFHGGGFVFGDIESHDGVTAQLAYQSGLTVISVAYRLAPEVPFPGGLLDAQNAFNWLYTNADKYHIDRDRMAIGGDSAGANLSTVICVLNRDQGKPLPAIQILIYPCTNGNKPSASRVRLADAPVLSKSVMEWMHGHYIAEERSNDPRFNVMEVDDLQGLPPAFVLTGGYDPLLDEGCEYAKKMSANGVDIRYSCYTNMFHGFYTYGVLPESKAAITETAEILARALK